MTTDLFIRGFVVKTPQQFRKVPSFIGGNQSLNLANALANCHSTTEGTTNEREAVFAQLNKSVDAKADKTDMLRTALGCDIPAESALAQTFNRINSSNILKQINILQLPGKETINGKTYFTLSEADKIDPFSSAKTLYFDETGAQCDPFAPQTEQPTTEQQ